MTRASLVLLVLFALAPRAEATPILTGDPTTVAFRAETCHICFPWMTLPDITLTGAMAVAPATGEFFDPWFGIFWTSAQMILDLTATLTVECAGAVACTSGTYNMTLLPSARGDGSYLLGGPRYITFDAIGLGPGTIINDNAYNLIQGPITAPLAWSQVTVPDDAGPLTLLVMAFVALILAARWGATHLASSR